MSSRELGHHAPDNSADGATRPTYGQVCDAFRSWIDELPGGLAEAPSPDEEIVQMYELIDKYPTAARRYLAQLDDQNSRSL